VYEFSVSLVFLRTPNLVNERIPHLVKVALTPKKTVAGVLPGKLELNLGTLM
jgi:hypothetical protein